MQQLDWDKERTSLAATGRVDAMQLVGRKHPALNEKAADVERYDENLMRLAYRMLLTCTRNGGMAIAAPQVGRGIRLIVTANGEVMANPRVEAGGKLVAGREGCLSLPGRWYEVPRYDHAVVVGYGLDGKPRGVDAADIVARMWQHEEDHLNGLLLRGRYDEIRDRA